MKSSFGYSSILDRFLNLIESASSSDRLFLRIAFFAIIATLVWLIFSIDNEYSETIPVRGGSFIEGILGTPRFINPVLATTRADQDVTSIVYSGLMKINPDGNLVNDIAKSINLSEDGLTYNIVLRQDVKFHDGTLLTSKDVIYTLQLIQDPDLKSPLRGNWTDVTIEEINDHELNIVLKEPYVPFIENFTIGIMPSHLWKNLPIEQLPFSQLNTEPVGSGPFSVTSASRDQSGLINHYTLTAFRENEIDPKINNIELSFYQNEDTLLSALKEEKIDATIYLSPEQVNEVNKDDYQLIEEPLPRSFGIFLNQNRNTALRDSAVRKALTDSINRDELIKNSLYGHGVPIFGPTKTLQPELKSNYSTENTATSTQVERAKNILEGAGWTQNSLHLWEKKIDNEQVVLSITLRTSNASLFNELVESIAKQWEAIGVEVTTEQFEQTGLVQSVIRPRDFEALLFGLEMSRSYDLYPFWHSSQQSDPGLNIAQYTNVRVDELLAKTRTEQSEQVRIETLNEASAIITKESPAIFLFQPTFTYIVDEHISVTEMKNIGRPADRFSNVTDWHTESDSLWSLFDENSI